MSIFNATELYTHNWLNYYVMYILPQCSKRSLSSHLCVQWNQLELPEATRRCWPPLPGVWRWDEEEEGDGKGAEAWFPQQSGRDRMESRAGALGSVPGRPHSPLFPGASRSPGQELQVSLWVTEPDFEPPSASPLPSPQSLPFSPLRDARGEWGETLLGKSGPRCPRGPWQLPSPQPREGQEGGGKVQNLFSHCRVLDLPPLPHRELERVRAGGGEQVTPPGAACVLPVWKFRLA